MDPIRRARTLAVLAATALCGIGWILSAPLSRADEERLWRFRNLGKALYENPTTQRQAVDELRKARDLAPGSAREIVNYGLALLRAGDTAEGIAQLEKAQKLDPKLPYTWFNLGIALKKLAEFDRALPLFQQMARLVPSDPPTHYQIGSLYKLAGDLPAAVREFEQARDLNPRLSGPHFQLYGLYRQTGRPADAAAELKIFQELKKQQEGMAVPEDMEWNVYCEIYDTPPVPPGAPPALWAKAPPPRPASVDPRVRKRTTKSGAAARQCKPTRPRAQATANDAGGRKPVALAAPARSGWSDSSAAGQSHRPATALRLIRTARAPPSSCRPHPTLHNRRAPRPRPGSASAKTPSSAAAPPPPGAHLRPSAARHAC